MGGWGSRVRERGRREKLGSPMITSLYGCLSTRVWGGRHLQGCLIGGCLIPPRIPQEDLVDGKAQQYLVSLDYSQTQRERGLCCRRCAKLND